ncbi:hypothetical protein [Amycolatopsis pithecellobii]|uniref:Uncharacterized protein n=1 Tax=Amycolatopsis pithecellobii TaxID=664692 RepID=A0A6N7YUQ9_9PSEU|nr:hypothetical protein [Amycolatopsis pithecellobii]MTD55672.1 hypothetical protein [Amycolatopsis pithecellobii]
MLNRVYLVIVRDRLEVFDNSAAAEAFAGEDPGAVIRSCPLRRGTDDARVVHDWRVVVRDGRLASERRRRLIEFYEGEFEPPPADVEAYEHEPGEWHVAGHGTDEMALNAAMRRVVGGILTSRT